MYFIQGENMATKKDGKTNSDRPFKVMDGMLPEPSKGPDVKDVLKDILDNDRHPSDYDWQVRIKKIAELLDIPCAGPRKVPRWEEVIITRKILFAAAQLDANVSKNFKKAKANPLDKLEENIPEKNIKAISKAIINYFDVVEKAQSAIAKEIGKIIPEGIELKPADFKKPVYPNVDVIIPYPKTPIPDPKIPLDPKIPIPYPKTPLDPKIPIPRPEIKIHGPYVIKDLEIKLAEVERIRKSLPKNATKAEKKAAANAEQQIKNLLKAAKRTEPKAVKKASVQKTPKKKK